MKQIIIVLLFIGLIKSIYADSGAYSRRQFIRKESEKYVVNHFHDCSALLASYWRKTDQEMPFNPFLNRSWWYSYIELIDKESEKVKFKIAAPVLSHLFIDERNKVIIGMSKVKLRNPYSLTLWDLNGNPIYVMNLRDSVISCPTQESVSNFFEWYGEKDLEKYTGVIVDHEKLIGLRTVSIKNELCGILFPKKKNSDLFKMKVDYSSMDDNYTEDDLFRIFEEIEFQEQLEKYLYPSLLIVIILAFIILKKKNAYQNLSASLRYHCGRSDS